MPGKIKYRLTPEAQRLLAPLLGEAKVSDGVIDEQEFSALPQSHRGLLTEFESQTFDEQRARMVRARGQLGGHTTSAPLTAAELLAAARDFRAASSKADPGTVEEGRQATRALAEAALLEWRSLRAPGNAPTTDAHGAAERSRSDARVVAGRVDRPEPGEMTTVDRLRALGLSADQADLLIARGVEMAGAGVPTSLWAVPFIVAPSEQLLRMGMNPAEVVEAMLEVGALVENPRRLEDQLRALADAGLRAPVALMLLKEALEIARATESDPLVALPKAFGNNPSELRSSVARLIDGAGSIREQGTRLRLVEDLAAAGEAPGPSIDLVRSVAETLQPGMLRDVQPKLLQALIRGGYSARDSAQYVRIATETDEVKTATLLLEQPGRGPQDLSSLAGLLKEMNAEASRQSSWRWLRDVSQAMEGGASYAEAKAIVAFAAADLPLLRLVDPDSLIVNLLGQASRRGQSPKAALEALLVITRDCKTATEREQWINLLALTNADLAKAASNRLEELSRAVNATVAAVEAGSADGKRPPPVKPLARFGKGDVSVLSSKVVLFAQELHDLESQAGDTDVARTTLFQNLPASAAFHALCMSGELYTSSYLQLLGRWKSAAEPKGIAAWLDAAKVEDGSLLQFCDNLARFQRVDEALALRKTLLPRILDRLSSGHASDGLLGAHVSLAAEIHARMEPAERDEFEQQLRAAYAARPKMPAIPYLLRYFHEQGRASPETQKLAKALPALAPEDFTSRLKNWLKDGVLSARLFFYPDEKSFDEALVVFTKEGFTVESQDANNVVLERTSDQGPLWRISMTRDPKADRRAAMSDPSVDIVAHRGHSFHFAKTFLGGATVDYGSAPKLLIGGSCGSLRSMTESAFTETYGTHSLIADVGTGEGTVNNQVLLDLLAGLSSAPKTWKDVGLAKYAGEEIIPPDHLLWGLKRYAKLLGR